MLAAADVYSPLRQASRDSKLRVATDENTPIFQHLPQMPIDPRLSAKEVFEIHKAAVTRDFVAKPRLGKLSWRLSWSLKRKE